MIEYKHKVTRRLVLRKKLCLLITTLILVVTTILASGCADGCSFISDNGDISNLPDSNIAAQSVTLGQGASSSERQPLSLPDAVDVVGRSSVAIRTASGGAASGVLIDVTVDGEENAQNYAYIITCHHVISGKGVINVFIPDQTFGKANAYENENYIYAGVVGDLNTTPYYVYDNNRTMEKAITLVGGDQDSDIAILKLDLTKKALSGNTLSKSSLVFAKVPPASYSVRMGESVFAVGNPTGTLEGTVSSGIVSYLEREVNVENVGSMILMQIDVPTNPGSSGGGLYNLYGELIGITNSGLEDQHGLNNAIPMSVIGADGTDNGFVNMARSLIATCTYENGNGNFGYISGRREKFGFTVTRAISGGMEIVQVLTVKSGSMSDLAGLAENDVVKKIKINSVEYTINTYQQFTDLMATLSIGDTLTLVVSRQINALQSETKEVSLSVRQFIFCDTGIYPAA